jgi:hypothetical protein
MAREETPLTKLRIKSPQNHGSLGPKAGSDSPAARKILDEKFLKFGT